MNCNQARDHLLDLAQQDDVALRAVPGLEQHLGSCGQCAAQLLSLRQTMALLDEWPAPEPSPYFASRLRARMRETAAAPAGWLHWIRKPAIALALAVLMVASISLFRSAPANQSVSKTQTRETQTQEIQVANRTGSAVDDLQQLDHDGDMYANFDLLDELGSQNAEAQSVEQ